MEIEGRTFGFFYDFDQLRDRKITGLSDDGKILWFKERVNMLLVRPVSLSFEEDSSNLSLRERFLIWISRMIGVEIQIGEYRFRLTAKAKDGSANLVIGMFSLLLNGIESLGSFVQPRSSTKGNNFEKFIERYMPNWDIEIPHGSLYGSTSMVEILWDHFRNGIAHGFIIEHGGLNFDADTNGLGYFIAPNQYLQIGPRKFIADFKIGLAKYFEEITNNTDGKGDLFISRFNRCYPN